MIKYKGIAALFTLCLIACSAPENIGSLKAVHGDIRQAFPAISHISSAELETQLAAKTADILILDTRPAAEYNVSHIEGAIQVSPEITAQSFKARFGEITANKSVIVYCSVGWRSSAAAHRLTEAVKAAGGRNLSNLEGGLFGWHNEGRSLVNAFGPTTRIHPYNDKWGALVSHTENLAYSPTQP